VVTIHEIIAAAFAEDIPNRDITTDNLKITEKKGYAFLMAKADIKLSGSEIFEKCMHHQAPEAAVKWFFQDGDTILRGQKVASIYGNLLPILKGERVALNFLGFLSGIATSTHLFVSARAANSKLQILDTRKTMPLYREWIKKAVRDGGGLNHRMNLSDGILIKENHIRFAGSISAAVTQIREKDKSPIEVEVSTLAEVVEAVSLGVSRLLFDNMSDEMIAEALDLVPEEIQTEASGNMTVQRVAKLSQLEGLDFVSVGAITHSAPTADLSLLFDF